MNKLTKIVNNLHMNLYSVACQDHKITKKTRIKSNKNYFEIAKKCFKKGGIWVRHYAVKS